MGLSMTALPGRRCGGGGQARTGAVQVPDPPLYSEGGRDPGGLAFHLLGA